MIKLIGNLLVLVLLYSLLWFDPETTDAASSGHGIQLLTGRIGLYGILSLAAGMLIITGGIDLSIGSAVALFSVIFHKLLYPWTCPFFGEIPALPPSAAILVVLLLGAGMGLIHGLLITKTRIQAFVVTLCGLFIYRSLAKWITGEEAPGLGSDFSELKAFWNTNIYNVPVHFITFVVLIVFFGIFLHFTRYGRYFYAIGSNEKAAQFCGLPTTFYKISAYVLCSTMTALFSILNMLKMNQVQPSSTGNMFELYGIAAAVMGGCSLRGGEGNVLGIFLGTCVLWLLPRYITLKGYASSLEGIVFGLVLLVAALLDEMIRRYSSVRKG